MYEYRPLPTRTCIRVLRRLPVEQDYSPLKVSLKTIDLAHNPPAYHALSYTWGNPHATGTDYFSLVADEYHAANAIMILCDGEPIHVQLNLYDALRELPHTTGGSSDSELEADTNIWIDAICINQQDPDERASQVKLMDRVYSQASHTIIWLGPDDVTKSMAAAADTVSRIASYPRAAFCQSSIIPFKRQGPEEYINAGLEPPTSWEDWKSLGSLLKRQWFKRAWIVQECILSRHLVIYCGSHRISWGDFVAALRNIEARCAVMGSRSPSTDLVELGEVAVPLEHNPLQLASWREHHRSTSGTLRIQASSRHRQEFTLEMLVRNTWAFHATNPRDKIYGLLGLLDPSVRDSWVVDYEHSVEKVYAYATRRIIEQSRSLEILSCIQDPSVRTTVGRRPSWTPDFGLPYVNMMCSNGHFSATGMRPDAHQFQSLMTWPSRDRLRCKQAAIFDTIVETANDRLQDANVPNSMMLLDPSWFEMALLLPQPYHNTGQTRGEALWRTLCADQDPSHNNPAPSTFALLFKELVAAMVLVQADLEAEMIAPTNSCQDEAEANLPLPANCSSSFSEALQRAKTRWTEMGWDGTPADQLIAMTAGSPPRLLGNRDRFGWLVFTLLKMQILAKTEEYLVNRPPNLATIPDWDFLEEFAREPSYIMRSKHEHGDGEVSWLLNAPPRDRRGFFDSFRQRYGKRKLFYTEKGYLGLGPASAKVGDVVCLFPGADAPFVCRRKVVRSSEEAEQNTKEEGLGQHGEQDVGPGTSPSGGIIPVLRIIGESYVHGIMHGEAVRGGEDMAMTWTEVEIV